MDRTVLSFLCDDTNAFRGAPDAFATFLDFVASERIAGESSVILGQGGLQGVHSASRCGQRGCERVPILERRESESVHFRADVTKRVRFAAGGGGGVWGLAGPDSDLCSHSS